MKGQINMDMTTIVLDEFPNFISNRYKKIFSTNDPELKLELIFELHDIILKTLSMGLVSQYLIRDKQSINDPYLNEIISKDLYTGTLGTWFKIFFATLRVYKGQRDFFFIKELYDFYWSKEGDEFIANKDSEDRMREFLNLRLNYQQNTLDSIPKDELAKAALELLEKIFDKFLFFQNYRMVSLKSISENQAVFQVFVGGRIEEEIHELNEYYKTLEPGIFYLENEENEFLELDPLIILWDDGENQENTQLEIGLFEKFSTNQLVYWLTKLTERVQNPDKIEDFLYFIIESIETYKNRIVDHELLSWVQLSEIAEEISSKKMTTVDSKYEKSVYLQRETVLNEFQRFLSSSKQGFVLVGKSGVGKTNFILSLRDEIFDENSTLLMLDAGSSSKDMSITEQITKEFNNRIRIRKNKIENIWEEISLVDEINDKHVLLVIDAINENQRPKEILREIIDLLQGPWPWLKIVVTSRPQAWKSIKIGVKLPENLLYRVEDGGDSAIRLDGFSYSKEMSTFSGNELALVYEKHRKQYNVQTEFDVIPYSVKAILQDPLVLWLTMSAYAGKPLPDNIKGSEIISDYIKVLILSERIRHKDLEFLRYTIIPLMISESQMSNAIKSDVIVSHQSNINDLINEETVLNDGNRVNQSFTNLVDADILIKRGDGFDYEIRFKYERFYDYFCGEFVYKAHQDKPLEQKLQVYDNLITQLESSKQKQYLWGVLKHALVLEFEKSNHELIDLLAKRTNEQAKQLIIAVLEEVGKNPDHTSKVTQYVRELLHLNDNKLNNFISRFGYDSHKSEKSAARSTSQTALEVARRLNMIDILEEALFASSATVRYAAIRNIYYYWLNNIDQRESLISKIEEKVLHSGFLKSTSMLDPCLGVTVLMMRHYYPNTPEGRYIGERLLLFWRRVLRKLLLEEQENNSNQQLVAPFVRNSIVNALVNYLLRGQKEYTEEKPGFIEEYNLLIAGNKEVKSRYSNLISFLKAPGDINDILDELRDAIADNDSLTAVVVWFILLFEYKEFEDEDLKLIEELILFGLEQEPIGINMQALIQAVGFLGYQKSVISDALYLTHQRVADEYLIKSRGTYYSKDGTAHPNAAITQHLVLRAKRDNLNDRDLFAEFLQKAVNEKDWGFVDRLLDSLLTVVSGVIDMDLGKITLNSLKPLFPIKELELENRIMQFLAKMRLYYQEEVDFFLLEVDEDNELLPKVLRVEPKEENWSEMINNTFASILIRMLDTPEVKNALVEMLSVPATHNDLNSSLKSVIKILINVVAGKNVF